MNLKTVMKKNNNLLIRICLCFLLITPIVAISGYLEEDIEEQTLELLSATLFGKGSNEHVNDIAVGVSGNIYLMGVTHSNNFPTTAGVYD